MPQIQGQILYHHFGSSPLLLAGLHRIPILPGYKHSYIYTLREKTFLGYLPQVSNALGEENLEIIEVVPTQGENKPVIKNQMICVYSRFRDLVTTRPLSGCL